MDPDRFDESLRSLREAWRGTRPRDPSGELEHADAATRASVEWMRRAWKEVEAELGERPLPRAARRSRPTAQRALVLLAAAAFLAASAALWLRVGERRPRDVQRPRYVQTEAAAEREMRTDPIPEPAPEERPRVEAAGSDLLVLRSGPVRLYLATGAGAEPLRDTETHR